MKNLKILVCVILTTLFCQTSAENLNEKYTPTRKEWITTRISNYLSSFHRFDNSLLIIEPEIRISIYVYNDDDIKDAKSLLARWSTQVEIIKNEYIWAKSLKVTTNIYKEFSPATQR